MDQAYCSSDINSSSSDSSVLSLSCSFSPFEDDYSHTESDVDSSVVG